MASSFFQNSGSSTTSEATIQTQVDAAEASATAAAASATSAATNATNAANSASSIGNSVTSASNFATSASNSAASASNSDTSSSNSAASASTSASTATTKASEAATSATNAATSASNAETAKVAAEAVYDLFDDSYLGAYATDPTLDNDGNALADGALFFDTTINVVKVYDLGTTTWLRLTPTLVNQQNINTVAGISADIETLADIEDGTTATDAISTLAPVASDVSTLASVSADIQTLADIEDGTTATNAISTVATNVTSINNFAERYTVSASAPSSPNDGDLWFDTTNDIMKVYNATTSSFQSANLNAPSQLFDERNYTATAGQTNFTASYTVGFVDVFLNGVRLEPTSDFTATSGTEIVLTTGATLDDSIFVRGYQGFDVANTVPVTGGTFTGNISAPNIVTSGTVFVPKLLSTVTITDGDNEIDFNSTYITDDYTHYKIITDNIESNINGVFIPEVALQFGTADTPDQTTTYYTNLSWIINRSTTSSQVAVISDANASNRMVVIYGGAYGISYGGNIEINLVNLRHPTLHSGYVLGSDSTYFNSFYDGFVIPNYSNGGYHHENRTVLQGKSAKTNFVRILNTNNTSVTSFKSGTIKLYGYNR